MKEKKKKDGLRAGALIIASAIIWGVVIVSASFRLKGTECYQEISNVLYLGFLGHFILIWTPLALFFGKKKDAKDPNA